MVIHCIQRIRDTANSSRQSHRCPTCSTNHIGPDRSLDYLSEPWSRRTIEGTRELVIAPLPFIAVYPVKDEFVEIVRREATSSARRLHLELSEDVDAATIGEIMGISTNNVRVQVHRIKKVLARRCHAGGTNDD